MNLFITHNTISPSKGFSLIEVLIAMVVLSIGLLGLAALQVAGMKNNSNAYQRSQANTMAYDIADRMRSNMVAVVAGDYNAGTAAADSNCLSTTGCNAAEMAGHDLSEWDVEIAARLPNGTGIVCIDSTPNDGTAGTPACDGTGTVYVAKIWWQERGNTGTTPVQQRFTMSFQP